MPVARPESTDIRVIAHVDLDCFYVQVEQRRHPELKGTPTAVVMYNPWRGGGIIAVGYEARSLGVKRSMRGDDAKEICPQIKLVQVPTHFGKADLSVYRDAGSEVVAVFSRGGVCERASIDEVYLDITEAARARLQNCPPHAEQNLSQEVLNTHVVGLDKDGNEGMEVKDWLCRSDVHASKSDQLLACGAMIIAELRTAVCTETGFTTSAGIAHNKMLAKLASGMHKPAQQTLIPSSGAPDLLAALPVKKLKGLGGKLGNNVEQDLGIKTIGDLLPYAESKLQDLYGKNTGTWLWRVARGMSGDEVDSRTLPKSHGCGKTFPGPKSLKTLDSVAYWLSELAGELQERLDIDLQQNNRRARLLVCHSSCHLMSKAESPVKPFPSKSGTLRYGKEKIAADALILFKRSLNEFCPGSNTLSPVKGERDNTSGRWGVTALSISANTIIDASGTVPITQFFASPAPARAPGIVPTLSSRPSSTSAAASSLSHAEEYDEQERFGLRSLTSDETVSEGQLCSLRSDASYGMPIEGPSKVVKRSLDLLDTESAQLRHHSHPQQCASMVDPSMTVFPANVVSEQPDENIRDSRFSDNGDYSTHMQSRSFTRSALSRPENGAGNIVKSVADPVCTPTFGQLGVPFQTLTTLDLPEELSPSHSHDLTASSFTKHPAPVQPEVDSGVPQSPRDAEAERCTSEAGGADLGSDRKENLDATVVINEMTTDLGCDKEENLDETVVISEMTTAVSDICTSPERVHAVSLGPDLGSHTEAGIDVSECVRLSPSPATETPSETSTKDSLLPRSNHLEKSKDVTSISQQVDPTGPSKKLVFQRVDDLWDKSRSPTKIVPSAKRAGISTASWNYKQNEIDESVLSELPEEIQLELRSKYNLKRPKTGRSTIRNFFGTSSSATK